MCMDVCLQMDAVKNETYIFNYAGKEKKNLIFQLFTILDICIINWRVWNYQDYVRTEQSRRQCNHLAWKKMCSKQKIANACFLCFKTNIFLSSGKIVSKYSGNESNLLWILATSPHFYCSTERWKIILRRRNLQPVMVKNFEERFFKNFKKDQIFYHHLIFSSVSSNSTCQTQERCLELQKSEHDIGRIDIFLPPFQRRNSHFDTNLQVAK